MRIAYRREIGDDLAEGIARAAQKWGRWDEDTSTGLLARPNWGYCEHNEPRAEVEWSYGSIFSERDINEHGVHNAVYNTSIMAVLTGAEPPVSAENMAKQLADQSGLGDPLCFDWSEEGIYTDARVREIHWNRAYGRFWLQSLGMCDWVWPDFVRGKFEDFKSRFYVHEGFEESTGRPTRAGLETLGLGFAADALEAAGKLGS